MAMTSCSDTGAVENATATAITVAKAKLCHGRAGVEFIDPRPAEAIASTTGRIPGARLIPIADIEAGKLPPALADRTLHLVTTCLAGHWRLAPRRHSQGLALRVSTGSTEEPRPGSLRAIKPSASDGSTTPSRGAAALP